MDIGAEKGPEEPGDCSSECETHKFVAPFRPNSVNTTKSGTGLIGLFVHIA